MFSSNQSNAAVIPAYIEEVFSTYLYTGTGATQTITNNIDLSTKGGLVWIKGRSGTTGHRLTDTARGATKSLASETTAAEATETTGLTAFGTTGFTIGADADYNTSAATYVSWSLRKKLKFFDILTYTGTGSNTTIAHALGSVPGCIIVKRTDTTADWQVYHRSNANTQYMALNTTAAVATGATRWNSTTPTSSVFSLGTDASVNASGGTYVAYIFAHDAGGFGLTGTDNVISCGAFTTDGSGNATVSLGYEPQWILLKSSSDGAQNWSILDTMRGWNVDGGANLLDPNTSAAEASYPSPTYTYWQLNSTGFKAAFTSGNASKTYIYIAIRRGPMAVPTTGTSVFAPYVTTSISLANAGSKGNGVGATAMFDTGFITDFILEKNKSSAADGWYAAARLTGTNYLLTNAIDAEASSVGIFWDSNKAAINYASSYGLYPFKRAPSFMDVVCYTGDGTGVRAINHNLGVTPTFIIEKPRNNQYWVVYHSLLTYTKYLLIPPTSGEASDSNFWGAAPTSSTFSVGSYRNAVLDTYVNYLFATCPGVSKVGSYTGTGALQTVDCGFTSGARFVLIKRTDSSGDYWIYDSARGITSGNDPYLFLNTTAAEVTSTNYVDTDSTGFKVTAAAPAGLNANGGTYIFLAIA